MAKRFQEYTAPLNLPEINKEMLKEWDDHNLFEASMREREDGPSFVFYEGPPSANGKPGIHHMMARTIKDIFCRYKTMQGYCVRRKAGWDTHGLPVELAVEKSLGITKEDIGKKISVDDYNNACRREVMKYTAEWTDLTHRMGYWVDLDDPYITYDNRYIESVWHLLGELYRKGYLYKGYTIQPYSPAAGTGLSSHELNQPGCYRDVKDTTATVLFRILDPKVEMTGWGTPYFMAWTTTPWTLPSNTALCVGPKYEYVALRTYNPYTAEKITVVIARDLVNAYFKPEGETADMDSYAKGDKVLPWRIAGDWRGSELTGMRYAQLMPWVKPLFRLDASTPDQVIEWADKHPGKMFTVHADRFVEAADMAFRVIEGDYVTVDDGTGIVHIAPTFGADDAKVAKAAGIPALYMINLKGETRPMVDFQGKYYQLSDCASPFIDKCVDTALYSLYQGKYVKNAYDPRFNSEGRYDADSAAKAEDLNIELCIDLKQKGEAFRIEKQTHNYPHCWRTDKPVIYYPLDSWFIRTTAARNLLMELNGGIKWKPAATGSGRFGKWLENLQDWNLSRSRYWGTPLPIWRTEDGLEEICISSFGQLSAEIDKAVEAGLMDNNPLTGKGFVPGEFTAENYARFDIHRPYVDRIVLLSPSGKPMKRETDLIDVWFDSGAMPYAQIHYPFENREALESGKVFPADFIAEGVDQTRGWFFTLHAIAGMVSGSVSYKAVISNGLVLDKNGNKMSKKLGNAINPFDNIARFGSDAVRWYMIENSQPWDNIKYDEEGVGEVSRKLFATIHNTYKFLALYANVDGFDPATPQIPLQERTEIDRWILSLLNSLVKEVTADLDDYEPTKAARAISTFVGDNLSNWYVRLNRKRFWTGKMDRDKLAAYQTLHSCLRTVALLMAPFAPFYADRLFNDLAACDRYSSVHLAPFPIADDKAIDRDLERRMALAQVITSNVLALRRKINIKVRQPLATLMIPAVDTAQMEAIEAVKNLVGAEVNVKEVRVTPPGQSELVKRVKADFKKLGPRYGKIMKMLAKAIGAMTQQQIAHLETHGRFAFDELPGSPEITLADVEIIPEDVPGWLVANEGNVTVALDVTLSPGLLAEGMARELVNRIQNLRKTMGLEITDRVRVTITRTDETSQAVSAFNDYISTQVLADAVLLADDPGSDARQLDIEGLDVKALVEKV